MTQTPQKDKPPNFADTPADEPVDDTTRELVEALAAAYFGACRKIAQVMNRGGKRPR